MNILLGTFMFFTVLPVIPFVLVLVIHYYLLSSRADKKKSVLQAADVTTLFLIISVSALFNQIFSSYFGIYLVILLVLIIGGIIGGAQNRMRGKVHVRKVIRTVWRLTFLGTVLLYFVFMIIDLFPYILGI